MELISEQIFIPLASALVGALIGFLGSLTIQRRTEINRKKTRWEMLSIPLWERQFEVCNKIIEINSNIITEITSYQSFIEEYKKSALTKREINEATEIIRNYYIDIHKASDPLRKSAQAMLLLDYKLARKSTELCVYSYEKLPKAEFNTNPRATTLSNLNDFDAYQYFIGAYELHIEIIEMMREHLHIPTVGTASGDIFKKISEVDIMWEINKKELLGEDSSKSSE